jgi:hypothetical protein
VEAVAECVTHDLVGHHARVPGGSQFEKFVVAPNGCVERAHWWQSTIHCRRFRHGRESSRRSVRPNMISTMPSWSAIEQAEPEFAARVKLLMESGRHRTLATLRSDGSPRISGIECEFSEGELRFGSMSGSRKGLDLKRDARFALHGKTNDPVEGSETDWPGEAKVAGRAVLTGPVTSEEQTESPDGESFIADITEVVITALNPEGTKLVVESWTPARGLRRVERD